MTITPYLDYERAPIGMIPSGNYYADNRSLSQSGRVAFKNARGPLTELREGSWPDVQPVSIRGKRIECITNGNKRGR
jgi:hypothetical protein